MKTPWYFFKNNQRFGPFTGHQIKELALMGKLDKQDLVQKGEDGQPIVAVKVKGLFEKDKNAERRSDIASPKEASSTVAPPSTPQRPSGIKPSPVPTPPVKSDGHADVDAAATPLWNPTALRLWSILFTWGFGAFLLSRNWKAMGEDSRAKRSMYWFYSAIAFLVLAFLLPDSSTINSAFRTIFLVLLAAWALLDAQPQINCIKENFGGDYQRKPWGKPLGIAAACLVIPVAGFVYSMSYPSKVQVVRGGYFQQYPDVPVGRLVDNFLGNAKWSTTTDAEGNEFVVVSGEIFSDDELANVLLSFRVEGGAFELHSAELNGQQQDEDFAEVLFGTMYLEFVGAQPVAESNAEQQVSPRSSTDISRLEVISADVLVKKFNSNAVAAAQEYVGKDLIVTGQVEKVREAKPRTEGTSGFVLHFKDARLSSSYGTNLKCFFRDSLELASLKAGDPIRIRGTFQKRILGGGVVIDYRLEECTVISMTASRSPLKPSASGKKLAAFQKVVEKYKQGVSAYATDTELSEFNKELQALQEAFYRVPFDPKSQLEEARAIAELYDSEIGNRFSGNLARKLNNYLREMVDTMLDQ